VVQAVPIGEGARSCAPWLDVPTQINVPANRASSLPCRVEIPAGAAGTYYAILVVEFNPEMPEAPMVVGVKPSIALRVQVEVLGPPWRLGMEVAGLRLEQKEAPQVVLTVANGGQVKTPISGDVLLRGPTGVFPARALIPHKRSGQPYEIYPGATVDIACPLTQPLPPGQYTAQVRAILLGNRRMQADFALEVPEGDAETVVAEFLREAGFKLNLEVEPTAVDLNLPPGARRTVGIRVRNRGEEEVAVSAQPALVRIEPDGLMTYASQWPADTPQWVEVPTASFTLGPGRSRAFRAQVIIPRDRPSAGTVVCAVLVKARAIGEASPDGVASIGEYPVLIVARAPKAPPAKLESQGLELVRPAPGSNPMAAVLRVKNIGGQLGQISGKMWLEGPQGTEMSKLEIGEQVREQILPGGIREFRLPLPPLDKGEHCVFARLKAGRDTPEALEVEESFTITIGVPEPLKDSGSESTASGAALTEE